MKYFKFNKEEDNKWYIVLPEWTGDKAELEMVCGADTMLDILAQGEASVNMRLSETDFDGSTIELHFNKDDSGGGMYKLKSEFYNFDVWLCHVTKFVFGHLPKIIYCA